MQLNNYSKTNMASACPFLNCIMFYLGKCSQITGSNAETNDVFMIILYSMFRVTNIFVTVAFNIFACQQIQSKFIA